MPQDYDEQCCATCRYYQMADDGYYVCNNPEADGYALETMYSDSCEDYGSKYEDDEL